MERGEHMNKKTINEMSNSEKIAFGEKVYRTLTQIWAKQNNLSIVNSKEKEKKAV